MTGDHPRRLMARARVRSEVAPVAKLELIVNGQAVAQLNAVAATSGDWLELEHELALDDSSWIAARASSLSPGGKPDAEAHTNPIYVYLDGKTPYRAADLDWLLARLDERIKELSARKFPEQPRALEYFNKSRAELLRIREAGGQPSKQ
jgi:hypothetical protein